MQGKFSKIFTEIKSSQNELQTFHIKQCCNILANIIQIINLETMDSRQYQDISKRVLTMVKSFFALIFDKLSQLTNYDLQVQIKYLLIQMILATNDLEFLKQIQEQISTKIFQLISNFVKSETYENILCVYIEI